MADLKPFTADPDYVRCECPLVSTHVGIYGQRVKYTDGYGGSHRGVRIAETLCCGLEFAIIPPGCETPDGYTDVKPVCLASGEVVRRIAVRAPTPCECCTPGGGGYTPSEDS